jgi:Nucleotidyltransferase domain
MQDWEKALDKFLEDWKNREDVIGFLVCGSYITGDPSRHSDIDLHIVTIDENNWRERGNKIMDGYLIEYFVNPPKQIRAYFRDDYGSNNISSPTQFATGRILLDKDGTVAKLKKEAMHWINKEFKELDSTSLSIMKYALWDSLDNLRDLYEKKSKSFRYAYYGTLRSLFGFYSRYQKWEVYSPVRIVELLTDPKIQEKYLQSEYPDPVFRELFIDAVSAGEESDTLDCLEKVVDYVFNQTGGFSIDGWVLRTPVKLSRNGDTIYE